MSKTEDPLVGRTIRGSIKIVKRIGEGGMGFVYEAYQTHLERKLAVKVMTPEHARNPVAADYFLREARSAARLRHPNIIQIIDFGKEGDDLLFLAMEFIPGAPLTELIELFYPLDKSRIIDIFSQTLSGLEEAHAHHVVHRDLKPDNLMIETTRSGSDRVKILDFGIAHLRDANTQAGVLTQQGAILGTPHYMSPEQARGERVDARSDLFSMGVILYEVLTAQRPFVGKNMPEILMKVMGHHPVPPSALRVDVEIDPGLEAVCMRALQKDEHLRYQSAHEFRLALEALRAGAEPQQPVASAKFIFKRRGTNSRGKINALPPDQEQAPSDVRGVPARAEQPTVVTPSPSIPPIASGLDESSQVVNVAALFDTFDDQEHTEEFHSDQLDTGHVSAAIDPTQLAHRAPVTAIMPESPRATNASVFGVDTAALRAELHEDLLGERRHVSVLVIHQRSYATLDAEDVYELNEEFASILQGLSSRWNAQLQSHQGSYHTLFFGFVQPSEDDHLRTAHMALELRKMCARFASRKVAFSMALAMGEVFCPGKQIERAAGAPLTLATESAQRAADDEILVVGDVLQMQLEALFTLSKEMGSGERSLITMRQTQEQSEVLNDAESTLQALVGREREMAVVLGALGRLSRQQGGMVCITGSAGMGKSALLDQAHSFARQRDLLTLRARHIYGGSHGLRDIFRQWTRDVLTRCAIPRQDALLGLSDLGLEPEYARLLQGLLEDNIDELMTFKGGVGDLQEKQSSDRAIEVAIRRLLTTLSSKRKLMIVLDEVPLFSEQLQGVCQRIMAHLSAQPVLFILALRTQDGDEPPSLYEDATLLHVERLDETACLAMFGKLTTRDLPDAFARKLMRLSAGIPLQVEQLAQIVNANPEASIDQIEEMLADSHDVNALMRLRLFALPSDAQNVLALLSVLGDATEANMLLDLASSSWHPEEAMQQLYDRGFLQVEEHVSGARLFFTPPAMRTVVYKNLSRKNRARVHERAAKYLTDRLERKGDLTREERLALAHHFERLNFAGLALEQLRALYDRAFRAFQYEDAQELLERMQRITHATSPDDIQQLARYELDMARIEFAQGHLKASIARVLKLDRAKILESPLDVEVRLELARQWLEHEDPTMLAGMLTKLVHKLKREGLDDPSQHWMLARAQSLLATTLEKQNKLTLAMQTLLDVIDFIEARELSATHNPLGPSLIWEPLNQLGRVRLKNQDMQGAYKMFQLALNSVHHFEDQLGEITVRGNMASLYGMQERYEEGLRQIQTAIGLARKSAQVRDLAKLLHNQGIIQLRQRRHDAARKSFAESEQICRELDWREGIAMNVSQIRSLEQLASRA